LRGKGDQARQAMVGKEKREGSWAGLGFGPWPIYRIGKPFKFSKPFINLETNFDFNSN
jgi:hypothetical protein